MSLLVFPIPAFNGQIYPTVPLPGQNVYQWSAIDQTWLLLGTATGVIPATYGNSIEVGQFTVDATGKITFAQNVPIQKTSKTQLGVVQIGNNIDVDPTTGIITVPVATTGLPGVVIVGSNLSVTGSGVLSVPNSSTTIRGAVQLVNNTVTNDFTKALTAAQGFSLQQQINALAVSNNLTFAGTINASTGRMVSVTPEATASGFVVGGFLPIPTLATNEFFVIVTTPGTFTPTGTATPISANDGDWFIQIAGVWTYFNVGPDVPRATFIQFDNISSQFNGSQTIFTLAIGGVPYFPGTNENVLISLGGVLQIPGQSFIIVGDSIDFSPVPPAPDTTFLGYSLSGVSGSGGIAGTGTVTQVSTGNGLIGGPISTSGTISLKVATTGALGGVIPDGTTITVSGAGVITSVAATPQDLQQVTDTGATTTNTMKFFDSVSSAEAVRIEPDISQITLYPQTGGDPGLAINSNSVAFSNSTGAVRASGIFPSELTFRGSLGLALQTVGPTVPVGLWAGGLSGVPAPQVSVTNVSTTVSNQLIASGLSYPIVDGTANQVLKTDGSGTLGWLTTAQIVSPPPASSATPGVPGQIAFGAGFFYWYDGTQWLQAAGSTF